MDSVNPMNVLKLLEEDYKQLCQLDGQPREADKQLKELVKEFMDVKINRAGSSLLALEEDLHYELQTDMRTFDKFEKLVAASNQLAEPDENPSQEDKVVEPLSSGTEPSSNKFYVPRITNPKQPPKNAVTLDYKKRYKNRRSSENSMTHSYTVMMTISPGKRKFLPQLWITLQEDKGVFGPILARTMFRADNLYVTASASGKMTKKLYLEWCEKILFSHVEDRRILLADSWRTYSDQEAVLESKPEELEDEMITILPRVTGDIQPLDRLSFRMYKDFFRKISSFIILHSLPLQVHHRYVILKMHSLVYQQFQSPRFGDLVNQVWHLCGYTDESFDYVNPTEFSFPKKLTGHCDHENCDERLLLKYGWCKAPLCFHHFYDQYHLCKIYLP
ncbi:LOW QUALITY PROTEIN: hypothetical protein RvY_02922 [Ramazzottius varieornatus]|uniref:Transposase Tc5 C-terminal domain-containing protein n=1 Tax=Ramazzottius varieornatus TaxID=947166 RepID=A0A1D1ULB7_RAMVA|nr:LOW QUALITY PROTEIN: hypothetical protein RvY_02922 [Ramazzottius varieornatus]